MIVHDIERSAPNQSEWPLALVDLQGRSLLDQLADQHLLERLKILCR
jgi:hypothetical protein